MRRLVLDRPQLDPIEDVVEVDGQAVGESSGQLEPDRSDGDDAREPQKPAPPRRHGLVRDRKWKGTLNDLGLAGRRDRH
jgi:hypothetical protein